MKKQTLSKQHGLIKPIILCLETGQKKDTLTIGFTLKIALLMILLFGRNTNAVMDLDELNSKNIVASGLGEGKIIHIVCQGIGKMDVLAK